MGFLDKSVDLNDFEKYKEEIEVKLKALNIRVDLKVTDFEAAAQAASERALEVEAKIKNTKVGVDAALKELVEYSDAAKLELDKIKKVSSSAETWAGEIASLNTQNTIVCSKANDLKNAISAACDEMTNDLTVIKAALVDAQKLPEQVEAIKKLLETSSTAGKNIDSLFAHSMNKKSEIDELHEQILGSDIKGVDGKVERVDGLVDVLSRSYVAIEAQIAALEAVADGTVKEVLEQHETSVNSDKKRFEELVSTSEQRYNAINDEILGLMPGAMAAGLSAAYEKKKDDEVESLGKHEDSFKVAIGLMVLVSLIPFFVDVFLLGWKGAELVDVIKGTPSLIVSILPLYFPVLWFAYSSSKKLNLSKRLIEEYTHKAVLGKTFSGLSNQIESLPRENVVRDELRTRLLFNMLQVSSENPGKLITDYNKSDHPLMDALENSAKLSDSVEALAKLPGFSGLAKKLAARTDELLSAQVQKVENGLATQEVLETPAEKQSGNPPLTAV
jgi:hypothetical protein